MAKTFVPRQRKHKVLARQRAQENAQHEADDVAADPNQEVLIPGQQRTKELEDRRARMKEALRQQDGAKATGKKAKRLEKYIDQKLRQDENRELMAKLAQSRVDTSLFASTRTLGAGKKQRRQEEHGAGIGTHVGVLREERHDTSEDEYGAEENEADDTMSRTTEVSSRNKAQPQAKPVSEPEAGREATTTTPAVFGAGLKRPLELDEDGRPVIPKKQKRGPVKPKFTALSTTEPVSEEPQYEGWNGFSDEEGDEAAKADSQSDEDQADSREEGSGSSSEEDTSDGSGSDDEDDEPDENDGKSSRPSAFKAWAIQQRNKALGSEPTGSTTTNMEIPKPDNFIPRAPEQDPLPRELMPTQRTDRKTFNVSVTRTAEVEEARLKLPIATEEQRLMEAIHDNDIVVVCGATGSGKTTQIPQFLYEAGFGVKDSPTPGMIGITQPRRVAAVSMSRRVADELGDHSHVVAHQIRFSGNVKSETAIKFMTDGVLMREAADDLALRKYSVIVIDEAHERSVNTDILIGMLSRVVKLRTEFAQKDPSAKPLKLIIMSATLRIEDLTMNPKLFSTPPPVLEVEGRQHPVTIHFARRTCHDYVEEAFRKISRGHKKLPPGGFLVFLTGKNEIIQLSKRLKAAFPGPRSAEPPKVRIEPDDATIEVEDVEFGNVEQDDADDFDDLPSEGEDEEEDEDEFKIEEDQEAAPLKMQILPLYSLLPNKDQLRVFEPAPEGARQIILATNVAETSLTIPGTRYVFDCGRSKERHFDKATGVQSFRIGWISQASANQRSGRAGRTGPGHCYRLYSSAVYERDFTEFADPELLRIPLEDAVLRLKALGLPNIVGFPFPTPPDRGVLERSVRTLKYLSALSSSGQITSIGRTMSLFPLSPRFARILLVGHLHNCLDYTITMLAGLSAAEVFVPLNLALEDKNNAKIGRASDISAQFNKVHKNFCYLDDRSDAIKLMQVVAEFAHEPTEEWCENHFVRFSVLKETQQLRRQLTDLLKANIPSFASIAFKDKLDPPSEKQVAALKQMAAAGFVDQVAIRGDLAPNPPEQYRKPKRPIDVPYVPLVPLRTGSSTDDPLSDCVYIHPTSPMSHLSVPECPEFIVYSSLNLSQPSGLNPEKRPKTRMHSLTDVTGSQLAGLAKGTPLLTYGKPIKELKTWQDKDGLMMRECWVVPYLRAENTVGQGWRLPARKVTQKKVPGKGWTVE
jgi:ATP-dependent RNA helicase DHX37/DHR1